MMSNVFSSNSDEFREWLENAKPLSIDGFPWTQIIEISNVRRNFQVYRVPLRYLIPNFKNGRILDKVLQKQVEMGRELDLFDVGKKSIVKLDGDLEIVHGFLKDSSNNHKELKNEMKGGQKDPGVVTSDGVLLNANRRWAEMIELYLETGDESYVYLDVIVLPDNLTKDQLLDIEAQVCISKKQQEDYSPINNMLSIAQRIEAGQSNKHVAKIMGFTLQKVEKDYRIYLTMKQAGLVLGIKEPWEKFGKYKDTWDHFDAGIMEMQRRNESTENIETVKQIIFHMLNNPEKYKDIADSNVGISGIIRRLLSGKKSVIKNNKIKDNFLIQCSNLNAEINKEQNQAEDQQDKIYDLVKDTIVRNDSDKTNRSRILRDIRIQLESIKSNIGGLSKDERNNLTESRLIIRKILGRGKQ